MRRAAVIAPLAIVAACGSKMSGATTPTGPGGGGGDMATCSAPRLPCGAACVDPMTDAHNCGMCGRDCGSATCSGGACAPVQLVGGPSIFTNGPIVSDGAYVYFSDQPSTCNVNASCYTIAKCGVGGCTNPFAFAAQTSGRVMAIASGVVYWSDTAVRACATSGQCAANASTTIANVAATALAADNRGVYLVSGGNVLACALAGCATSQTTLGSASTGSSALATDGVHVFFANATQIFSAPNDGSAAATTVVGGLTGVEYLAVDDANVYYALQTGELGSCAKSGCAQGTVLAPAAGNIGGLVADGTSLYWSSATAAHVADILRCPTSGTCTPALVASYNGNGLGGIFGFAVDAVNVYYTTGNAVMKALK